MREAAMEKQKLIKYYTKTVGIFNIAMIYIPAIIFVVYLDILICGLILGIYKLNEFVYLFSFPWWKITAVLYIQCLLFVFFAGIIIGLRKLFIRHKDFFLG